MGMFSSMSQAVQGLFNTVTRATTAVDESLSMATVYVHNRSVAFNDEDAVTVATASAKRQATIKHELEDDADAAKIFTELLAKMQAT